MKNLVPDFSIIDFNILHTCIYLSIYLLFLACMQGFTGDNCSSRCPYPTYGRDCQELCNCSKDMCDVSTGCQSFTTGYNVLYSMAKPKARPLIQFTYSHMYLSLLFKFDN